MAGHATESGFECWGYNGRSLGGSRHHGCATRYPTTGKVQRWIMASRSVVSGILNSQETSPGCGFTSLLLAGTAGPAQTVFAQALRSLRSFCWHETVVLALFGLSCLINFRGFFRFLQMLPGTSVHLRKVFPLNELFWLGAHGTFQTRGGGRQQRCVARGEKQNSDAKAASIILHFLGNAEEKWHLRSLSPSKQAEPTPGRLTRAGAVQGLRGS